VGKSEGERMFGKLKFMWGEKLWIVGISVGKA
jgi:hypothetical protein